MGERASPCVLGLLRRARAKGGSGGCYGGRAIRPARDAGQQWSQRKRTGGMWRFSAGTGRASEDESVDVVSVRLSTVPNKKEVAGGGSGRRSNGGNGWPQQQRRRTAGSAKQ